MKDTRTLLWIAILIIAGSALRLWHIGSSPLAVDEPFTVFHAQMDLKDLLAGLWGDNNPPLFELILHFWMKLAGNAEWAVRFPSFLFSMGMSLVLFFTGKKFFGFHTGIIASSLSLFSIYQLNFAHEARTYALFGFLTACALYLVLSLLQEGANRNRWILLTLVNVLLIYSHYFGLFVLGVEFLTIILAGRKDRVLLKAYAGSLSATALLFSPYIAEVLRRFFFTTSKGTWLPAVENLGHLHELFFYFANKQAAGYAVLMCTFYLGAAWFLIRRQPFGKFSFLLSDGVLPVFLLCSLSMFIPAPLIWLINGKMLFIAGFVGLFLLVWIVGIIRFSQKDRFEWLVVSWFLVPVLFYFAISFKLPVFHDRYLMFITPAMYLTLGIIVTTVFRGRMQGVAAIVLLVGTGLGFDPAYDHGRTTDKLSHALRENQTEGTQTFVCPRWFFHSLLYYYDKAAFEDYRNFEARSAAQGLYFVYHWDEVAPKIKGALPPRVILLDAYAWQQLPENEIEQNLSGLFGIKKEIELPDGMRLVIFEEAIGASN